jgi:2TM family of unknown function (DUF5676)
MCEVREMIKPRVLANAVATVVAAGYVLCRLLAAIAPGLLFNVGQSWFHTLDVEPIRAPSSMSVARFVLGLVSSVIVSWIGAYATAELYRRWARGGGPGRLVMERRGMYRIHRRSW